MPNEITQSKPKFSAVIQSDAYKKLINNKKVTRSIHDDQFIATSCSITPIINPPNTAPGIEPIPPNTAATKALIPSIPPNVGVIA